MSETRSGSAAHRPRSGENPSRDVSVIGPGDPAADPPTDAVEVVAMLQAHGQSVATAESVTGGLIGAWLTAVPGASASYRGGVVAYATDLKTDLAGVRATTLRREGPVAAGTAGEMAAGARARCRADWGLATTGVAGPEPQDGHRVGQVFLAAAGPAGVVVREVALTGDRNAIRAGAAESALRLLAELVSGASASGRPGKA